MLRILALMLAASITAAHAGDPVHTDGEKYKVRFENEKVACSNTATGRVSGHISTRTRISCSMRPRRSNES